MTEKGTKLIPLEDHILIEAMEEENKSKAWIILPDSKEKPSKWKVVAVGNWKILDNWSRWAIDIKVWDVVYFTKYAPDEIEFEWMKYLIIKQSSILAKQN
jgi:chaperonin GroES